MKKLTEILSLSKISYFSTFIAGAGTLEACNNLIKGDYTKAILYGTLTVACGISAHYANKKGPLKEKHLNKSQ